MSGVVSTSHLADRHKRLKKSRLSFLSGISTFGFLTGAGQGSERIFSMPCADLFVAVTDKPMRCYLAKSSLRTISAPALNALSLPLATRRDKGVIPQLVEG